MQKRLLNTNQSDKRQKWTFWEGQGTQQDAGRLDKIQPCQCMHVTQLCVRHIFERAARQNRCCKPTWHALLTSFLYGKYKGLKLQSICGEKNCSQGM